MSDNFCENNALLSNSVENSEYFHQELSDSVQIDETNRSYDHMYATNHEENGLTGETQTNCQTSESEVNFLKDFLLIHLDLIQQQNDDILNKENTIFILQQENARLKEQLSCMESGLPYQSSSNCNNKKSPESSPTSSAEDMTLDSSPQIDERKEPQVPSPNNDNIIVTQAKVYEANEQIEKLEDNVKLGATILQQTDTSVIVKEEPEDTREVDRSDCDLNNINLNSFSESSYTVHTNSLSYGDPMKNLKMSIRRKRLCSNSSAVSNNDSTSDEKRSYRRRSRKKRKRLITKNDQILTSEEQYVTQVGDESLDVLRRQELAEEVAKAASSNLEVPRWRVKVYTSCYTMEGTENLEDEVFLRRHGRLENDERRRKRWDVQRIREQRIVEKLKQRQDRIDSNNRGAEQSESVESLWPSIDDIKYIEMCDSLPVSAFGCPIPKLELSEFSLPWLTNPNHKKSTTRRNTGRRRGSKR